MSPALIHFVGVKCYINLSEHGLYTHIHIFKIKEVKFRFKIKEVKWALKEMTMTPTKLNGNIIFGISI